uniref:VENN motif pre-toxin domain-containing protein n=1 Tax=Pantoea sp. sgz302252 TaxID=3341827 RepID=UPI0036D27678
TKSATEALNRAGTKELAAAKTEWQKANPDKTPAQDDIVQQLYQTSYNKAMLDSGKGTGGALQQGISAATAAVSALAGGNLSAAVAGGAAPYLAELIHKATTTKDANGKEVVNVEANLIAHAVLGAAVAQASGGSALAGASGGAAGEYIAQQLYPGVDRKGLSEEQRQTISALGTLAAGLAGGLAGDSTGSAVTGAQAGKNAVENNLLSNKHGVENLDAKSRALYEKLKAAGIGGMDELQERFTACGDGECERAVRNEYRQQEKAAGEKLISMYKSGALTADDFNLLVTDYANTMLAGAKEGQLDSDYKGFLGDIYSQTGIDWTPMGVVSNPYVAAIKGSQQIAEWKSQGLSDEKIHDLALKNDVISSALSPVDVNGVMNLLDNGASGQDVIKFASGVAFNKVLQKTQAARQNVSSEDNNIAKVNEVAVKAERDLLNEINSFSSKSQANKSATMVGAYDPVTGKVAIGSSNAQINAESLHPVTVKYIEKQLGVKIGEFTSFCKNKAGACAEVSGADKLIRQGVAPENIKFTDAVRPRIVYDEGVVTPEAIIKPCANCQVTWPKGK